MERLVWNAKRHKDGKENKKDSRHKIRIYKENGFGWTPAILRFVFCQTARSKENKKISRHTLRKYIEIKYISMYFLIVCRLVFLFSLLRAVWQKKNRKGYRRHKIRKYKENGFGSSPAILQSCFLTNGTK